MDYTTLAAWRNLTRVTFALDDLAPGEVNSQTIERRLAAFLGVAQVHVNPYTEMAYIVFDPTVCEVGQIQNAMRELGFHPGEPQYRAGV